MRAQVVNVLGITAVLFNILVTTNAVAKGQIPAPATNNTTQNPSIPQPMPKEPLPVKKPVEGQQPIPAPAPNAHLGKAAAPVPQPAAGRPAANEGQPVALKPVPIKPEDAKSASLAFLIRHLNILVNSRGNLDRHDYEVRYGELMVSIKELLDLPPHLFGLSLKLQSAKLDENTLKVEIVDIHSNLILGEFRVGKDDKKNLSLLNIPHPNKNEGDLIRRSQDNINNLAAKYVDPFAAQPNMDPYLKKLAAYSNEMKTGRYANNFHEGEIEQLGKLYLGVDPKNWDRPIWSQFISGQPMGNTSMMIQFYDSANRTSYGIVGYHYESKSPFPLTMMNGGNGNQTTTDLLNEVRTELKMPLIQRR